MQDTRDEILIWLPSPLGDAILCTPALRAIREHFKSAQITFFGKGVVCEILSGSKFNNGWLELPSGNPFAIAKVLKKRKFTHAILFKNSFASALAVFLAGIPQRIGYVREGRGLLLTERLYPPRLADGRFKPTSMIDYYLAIASWLGADVNRRDLKLEVGAQDSESLQNKLPQISKSTGSVVILVPGGAFGLSKCWPSERFAKTADWLISNYNGMVVVSVSPAEAERQIAKEICGASENELINLGQEPLSLGELKSLFSTADLVISNDTGPRHIAIAFKRNIVTLFGPNDPAWTETDWENEIELVGDAPCAPCAKPVCKEKEHFCMEAITVEEVCEAAKSLLEKNKQAVSRSEQEFVEVSKSFFVDADFKQGFEELGLTCIDDIFSFSGGTDLIKDNLSKFRSRTEFEVNFGGISTTVFLKRYDRPPVLQQLKNRFNSKGRESFASLEFGPLNKLASAGINTPKVVAYGEQWGRVFEKRSFVIIEKIAEAESLERKLPDFFDVEAAAENLRLRRDFIIRSAEFVRKFHETGYCHRDLYFSHIFYGENGQFYLIDLARAFKAVLFAERYRVKDIAQLFYSAPGKYFSRTDRMRFYLGYAGRDKLAEADKMFIRKVIRKAKRIARHDRKHGRVVPFEN